MSENTRANILQIVLSILNMILMITAVIVQITTQNHLLFAILCGGIVLTLIPLIILDKKFDTGEFFIRYICWCGLWLFNLIVTCIRIIY